MTIQAWLMYLTLVTVATATPGPAVLFIMTKATLHGWRKSAFAALGNIIGLFCLGLLAVTVLGTVIKTSETVSTMIKYPGAAYLAYLGLKMIFQTESGEYRQPHKWIYFCWLWYSAGRIVSHITVYHP
jgi:homoserine/homoserine lactone efflux protein